MKILTMSLGITAFLVGLVLTIYWWPQFGDHPMLSTRWVTVAGLLLGGSLGTVYASAVYAPRYSRKKSAAQLLIVVLTGIVAFILAQFLIDANFPSTGRFIYPISQVCLSSFLFAMVTAEAIVGILVIRRKYRHIP